MKLDAAGITVELAGRRIVEDVALHIAPGELVGLIGPNGSGKSTVLRTVYRVLRPQAGRVLLNERSVWALTAREAARLTGIVVQEHPAGFEFRVREVVATGRTPHKGLLAADNRDDARIVAEALERVNMQALAERAFSTLSGGEKQRVLVARALAQQPQLLVLDEPTNHLDVFYQLELLELLRALRLTTLITLHDLNLAAAYCDRLYVLAHGVIVTAGRPEDVLQPDLMRRVFQVDVVRGLHPVTHRLQLSFMPLTHHAA